MHCKPSNEIKIKIKSQLSSQSASYICKSSVQFAGRGLLFFLFLSSIFFTKSKSWFPFLGIFYTCNNEYSIEHSFDNESSTRQITYSKYLWTREYFTIIIFISTKTKYSIGTFESPNIIRLIHS